MSSVHVLITGAGGFVGKSLASALLGSKTVQTLTLTDLVAPEEPEARELTSSSFSRLSGVGSTKINLVGADLSTDAGVNDVLSATGDRLDVVYILHGIMSGDSEADHALSLKVNVETTIRTVTALKTAYGAKLRVVYTSSLAVFGPQDQDKYGNKAYTITEQTRPIPTGTYGTHKAMMELFIQDLSRRGEIDARIVRLPTVIVRAGKPTGAASSFASGMFREPLQGITSTLPVRRDLEVWLVSNRVVIMNLMIAAQLDASNFGSDRLLMLPGQIVTVQSMIDALAKVGGNGVLDLLKEKPDKKIEAIVEGWATRIDDSLALSLGFVPDHSLEQAVAEFLEDFSVVGSSRRSTQS